MSEDHDPILRAYAELDRLEFRADPRYADRRVCWVDGQWMTPSEYAEHVITREQQA